MKPPFGLVLVHGDGSRVIRLSVPRWIVYGILGVEVGLLAVILGLWTGHAIARRQIAALRRATDDQRLALASYQRQIPAIREEIGSWKALHAKMWKSLDPAGAPPESEAATDGESPAEVALRPEDELEFVARGVAEEGPRLRELGRAVTRTSMTLASLPIRWPIHGPVNSEFGPRRSPWNGMPEHHRGMDIGSPPGTPVRSPAAGMVLTASAHGRLGKHVTLDHGNGVRSIYGHLEAVDVKAGDHVDKGQVIGRVGSTGRSTGPHLHYEVLVEGQPVDPRGFLGADGRPIHQVVAQSRAVAN